MGEMPRQLAMQGVLVIVNKLLRNTFLCGAAASCLKRELRGACGSSRKYRHGHTGQEALAQSSAQVGTRGRENPGPSS